MVTTSPGEEKVFASVRAPFATPWFSEIVIMLIFLSGSVCVLVYAITTGESSFFAVMFLMYPPTIGLVTIAIYHWLLRRKPIHLYEDSIEIHTRLRGANPRLPLQELSGIGLLCTSTVRAGGRTVAWSLHYGDAHGSIKEIPQMFFGTGFLWSPYSYTNKVLREMSQGVDLLASTSLGQFCAAVDGQARLVQGTDGLLSKGNALDSVPGNGKKILPPLTDAARALWIPGRGPKDLRPPKRTGIDA